MPLVIHVCDIPTVIDERIPCGASSSSAPGLWEGRSGRLISAALKCLDANPHHTGYIAVHMDNHEQVFWATDGMLFYPPDLGREARVDLSAYPGAHRWLTLEGTPAAMKPKGGREAIPHPPQPRVSGVGQAPSILQQISEKLDVILRRLGV